jgi:hypothetical protein
MMTELKLIPKILKSSTTAPPGYAKTNAAAAGAPPINREETP